MSARASTKCNPHGLKRYGACPERCVRHALFLVKHAAKLPSWIRYKQGAAGAECSLNTASFATYYAYDDA